MKPHKRACSLNLYRNAAQIWTPCSISATEVYEGALYCWLHYPPAVALRQEENEVREIKRKLQRLEDLEAQEKVMRERLEQLEAKYGKSKENYSSA